MSQHRCLGCMRLIDDDGVCPRCGYQPGGTAPSVALPPGLHLDKYLIGRELGAGGFGITYLAWDETLNMKLAVKEYLPQDSAMRAAGSYQVTPKSSELVRFREGMERFLKEARILARLDGAPGIVGVRDYFEANGTAYLVMRYIEGVTLRAYLKQKGGRLRWEDAVSLLLPAMEALDAVHAEGVLHRDISPDNIMVTPDGRVRLLDFGAARQVTGATLSVILKPGYAPEEQYRSRGHQGPWTDVYAMAATLWHCVTGRIPPESLDRLAEDTLSPPSRLDAVIPPSAEAALMRALALRAQDRTQSMGEFITSIAASPPTLALPTAHDARTIAAPPRDRGSGPSEDPAYHSDGEKTPRGGASGRSPMRSALLLIGAFAAVIAMVAGISWLVRSISNPFDGLIPTVKPTLSVSSAGPSPAVSPDLTPAAEPTPQPTPSPTPTPEPGELSAVAGSAYIPADRKQWIMQDSGGGYTLMAARRMDTGITACLTGDSDENGALNANRSLVYYVLRDGAVWRIPADDISRGEQFMPSAPRVNDTWSTASETCTIVGVNRTLDGYQDVVLIRRQSARGDEIWAVAPERGIFARYTLALTDPVTLGETLLREVRAGDIERSAYEAIAALSLDYDDVR